MTTVWRNVGAPYPNPATDAFRLPNVEGVVELAIENAGGTVVRRTTYVTGQLVNVDELAEGAYWVRRLDRPSEAWRLVIAR
jgi:hypothetical protein